MYLVKQIRVNKSSPYFSECDRFCILTKNLYNAALSKIKERYKEDRSYYNSYELVKSFIKDNQSDFRALPSSISAQTLYLLDRNFKSYFAMLKKYNKDKSAFKSKPKIPNFKDKDSDRSVTIIPIGNISKKSLKKGFLKITQLDFQIKTDFKRDEVRMVRIVPRDKFNYDIEIIYSKEEIPFKQNNNFAGIDLGLNNLATIVTNTNHSPIIINGKPLKSINQYYNKKLAVLKSKLPHFITKEGKKIQKSNSKKIMKLTAKRNRKIKDYLHKASRKVVNHLQETDISKVVVGQNKDWKQNINIGKKNNQNFVAIPHSRFISMCNYKSKLIGIEQITREESYTSKCSFLDNESIVKQTEYLGKRIERGLFKSSNNFLINADVNGASNILKKEFPNAFEDGIEGILVSPKIINLI